jgi:hypothetical protein
MPLESDARARADERGIEFALKDLADAGGAYDLDQVRHLLGGLSPQAIDRRVCEGSLLAIPGPNDDFYFPKLQFNADGTIVQGLESISKSFPSRNRWALLNFLVNPQTSLGGARPVDRLRAGALAEVLEATGRIGEQGS